jgi:signal transduction histidine kinase
MKQSHSIRAHVVHLVIAVTLPFLAFGAFLLIRSAQNEQQAIATTAHERAQGVAADLDRELRNLQELISILATSHYLVVGDFAASYLGAISSLKYRTLGILVRDLSGQLLLNTCNSDGRTFLLGNPLDNVPHTTNDSRALISDLTAEPISGGPLLTIDLLARREDDSTYILSLCALPRIVEILTEQHLPNRWTAMLADRRGHAIASVTESTGGSVAAVGADRAGISAADINPMLAQSGNFGPGYKASSPVDLAGWIVTINVPGDIYFGPIRHSLLVLLVAGGGTLALALILAANIGRRIAGPITELTGIASALGRGGHVTPPITGINEIDPVAHALCSTSEDLSQRTEELTKTVGALRHSEERLTELSGHLRRALDERTQLLNRMVSAQESERQRVARELHDHLGQYLAAMLLGLNAAVEASKWHDEGHQRIADLKTMTLAMSRDVHQLSWELRPTALDDLGLETAMASYLEKWSERFNLDVDFVGNLRGRRLPAPIEITLYRVLQEAMTNVAKHAHAERISVILDADTNEVRLVVEDDGTGYARRSESVHEASTGGFGLIGIRERLALVGGSLIIEPATDHGTALFCRIPA